ncbi:MAG TPA: hypothetical protein VN253_02330 [Kofleriaceae bacterium]|nr:hypothetical protein [Kofleriaceae bacterium]
MRLVLAMLLVTMGCGKKAKQGLPPAEDWDQTSAAGAMVSIDKGQKPRAMGQRGADPHAGVPGAPPLDDDDLDGDGDNPHAGMGGDNPHAGMGGGGVDVTQLGLPPPDPNRKIDPSHRVKGMIKVHAKAKDRVKPGGAVFVVVKRAGADGQPSGSPLAVEKLSWAGDGVAFELTEANAMSAGTELTGDVVVTARYDQDSDAISKQPGDVTGQIRVKVPADAVELTLDTILP